MKPIRRALLSVHDKSGLVELASALSQHGAQLIATGGTFKLLESSGLSVSSVSSVTGAPEILGGRVKTLHPGIHGGILARREDPAQMSELEGQGITPIDLVAVNLYPFDAVVARGGSLAEVLENIDIGGPTMLRAAAKNFPSVAVITDPADYAAVVAELKEQDGSLSDDTRERLAAKAFRHVARYDSAVAAYLSEQAGEQFTESHSLGGQKLLDLRYGENPHQRAAFYGTEAAGLATAEKLQGKELSYNNLLDLDAALACASDFEEQVVVIVKHTNPCGVATDPALARAYELARAADPLSAFGGIVAFNRPVDGDSARAMTGAFIEAVVAPGYSDEALGVLARKKDLRVLRLGQPARPRPLIRPVAGGFLLQDPDTIGLGSDEPRIVTKREPTEQEWAALRFAWIVAKHVKSNAIVYTTATATVGIGAGQMSRVDAAAIAARKAVTPLTGTAVASDAFFPFRDGVDTLAEAGATAVIQPGGSKRDAEVIEAADEHDLAMVLTGVRHFKH